MVAWEVLRHENAQDQRPVRSRNGSPHRLSDYMHHCFGDESPVGSPQTAFDPLAPTSASQTADSSKLSGFIVLGSTIGTLLLLVGIGFIMHAVHKRKRDADMEEEYPDQILCGRKIFSKSEPEEESWYLLSVFQKCWEQGTLLDMVDRHSEDMQVHNTEVVEMMKVASWCLQTNYKRRPSMSSVVKVLEGVMNVESNLDYNFTDLRIQETEVREEKDCTRLSSSFLSGPR
ncbi:hypothetical protein L1987_61554 [Smallanthus sonchifolius]|uniref:Uncharacterized protein n=1 Tax=Smallanthus sonchifolius TaxID=185202 RepID=A0ACB9C7X3_9ASTR|nr:hypothetical protein L1987_61554 [Smallanthus sonchifolius]